MLNKKISFVFFITANFIFCQISVNGIDGLEFYEYDSDSSITITENFHLHEFSISATDLTLNWSASERTFSMYGDFTISFDGNSLEVSFGTGEFPGLIIEEDNEETGDYAIVKVSMLIVENFDLDGLSFNIDTLHFEWDTNSSEDKNIIITEIMQNPNAVSDQRGEWFEVYNNSENEINLHGYTLKDNGSNFHTINSDLIIPSGSYSVLGRDSDFSLNGGIEVDYQYSDFFLSNGHDAIIIIDNLGVTVDSIAYDGGSTWPDPTGQSMSLLAHELSNNLGGRWEAFNGETYGDGDYGTPGEINYPNDTTNTSFTYRIYGDDVSLSIDGQSIEILLGDYSSPGILVTNGLIDEVDITINSDFHIAGLEVQANSLEIYYLDQIYEIHGGLTVSELWSVSVDLGSEDSGQGGLLIDTSQDPDKFKLESFIIEAEQINFGSLVIDTLLVSYNDDNGDYTAEVDLALFVQPGLFLAADIVFEEVDHLLKIDSVRIDIAAVCEEEGIEIPDTPVFLTEVKGEVILTDSTFEKIDAAIGFNVGGQYEIGDDDVTLMRVDLETEITPNSIEFTSDTEMLAYQDDCENNSSWNSILGTRTVTVDLNWTTNVYSAEVDIKMPEDYGLLGDGKLTVTPELIDAQIKIDLRVPEEIPVIGGLNLAEVDGAFHDVYGDANSSYAAAWTDILFWSAGIKYIFGNSQVVFIGGGDIDDIEAENSSSDNVATSIVKFTAQDINASGAIIKTTWKLGDVQYAIPWCSVISTGNTPTQISQIDTSSGLSVSQGFISMLYFHSEARMLIEPAIVSSLYNIPISAIYAFPDIEGLTMEHEVQFLYDTPTIDATTPEGARTNREVAVSLDYWAHENYTDQTVIHLFYDNDTSLYDQSGNLLRDSSTVYTGKIIGEYSYGNHHEIDGGYLTVNTILSGHVNNEHYYLYARIDDGINPPVYSKYTTPIFSSPPVHGEISLSTPEGRNFLQNYLVYLDINNNGRFDPMENEPHEYTNNNGLYAFHGIDSGEYRMDIFLHHGYKISIDSPTQLPLIVNYELGASLEFNFQIQDIDERW